MVKIKSIQKDGVHLTYDIHNRAIQPSDGSGEPDGNFCINGKIVHNSILTNGVRRFEDLLFFNAAGHPGPMACCWPHSKIQTEGSDVEIKNLDNTKYMLKCLTRCKHVKHTSKYKVVMTGKKKLKKITLSNGKTVIVTEDHRLGTKDGYEFVRNLKVGDKLLHDREALPHDIDRSFKSTIQQDTQQQV